MNTVHWPPQERVAAAAEVRTMDEAENTTTFNTTCGKTSISSSSSSFLVEKEIRCQDDQKQDMKHGINCRRCSSTNTKFCYYNNYSLSQPRYFCKTCKRYWTEGGSLRNIPVGGVSRKNMKRSSPSNSADTNNNNSSPPPPPPQQQQLSSPMSKKMLLNDQYHHHHHHDININNYNQHQLTLLQVQRPSQQQQQQQAALLAHDQNPNNIHIAGEQGREIIRHDLNLGLIPSEQNVFKTITELIQVPDFDKNNNLFQQYPLFMPTTISSSNNNYHHQLGNFHDQEDNRRSPALLFPFQDIKQVERKTSDSAGYRINGGTVLGSGLW